MRHLLKTTTTLGFCAALAACGSSDSHNIGEVGVTGARLSDYAGSWDGYAEAFKFEDGSDRLRIQLDGSGNGVLEVGDSDPLPEPDSTTGYPPSAGGPFAVEPPGLLFPGFSYPISGATVQDSRIQFSLTSVDVYAEWCAGMEPVLDDVNSGQNGNGDVYACLPNEAFSSMQDPTGDSCKIGDEPIDCGLLDCSRTCACDADACAAVDNGPDVSFDGALEGGRLVGTLVVGDRITARLNRTP